MLFLTGHPKYSWTERGAFTGPNGLAQALRMAIGLVDHIMRGRQVCVPITVSEVRLTITGLLLNHKEIGCPHRDTLLDEVIGREFLLLATARRFPQRKRVAYAELIGFGDPLQTTTQRVCITHMTDYDITLSTKGQDFGSAAQQWSRRNHNFDQIGHRPLPPPPRSNASRYDRGNGPEAAELDPPPIISSPIHSRTT
jgi:hypothetical protein